MKKNIYLLVAVCSLLICSTKAKAQDFDTDPVLQLTKDDVNMKIGGRFMADAAYYNTDYTSLKSGAAIVDARIRAGLSYENWYFYADFDFSRGDFKQKNIFLKYTLPNVSGTANHSIKAGYYAEPNSMSLLTSLYSYRFMTRAGAAEALGIKRSLGISYKFYNNMFTATQGVFAENKYNDQLSGFQGVSVSGRWLVRPVSTDNQTLHVGFSARYADVHTGEMVDGVNKTSVTLQTNLHSLVDDKNLLQAELPWAKGVLNLGAEILYHNSKFFARGEYLYKKVTKERPDELLFTNQLGGVWSWTTLASWQKGNPIRSNSFDGAYAELGYQIFGSGYTYSKEEGMLNGHNGRALEVVARYNYTNLNDITEGDVFLEGRQQFYPNGKYVDYPPVSTSIGGGKMHSVTVGLNFAFNKNAKIMLDYTYNKLDNVYYSMDKNFHVLQARTAFSF
ncbi:hypothetical protein JGH11_06565 [Dysgonomonas sp. Marseille-P4677]|uniref:porin n=1 Tax=Dysgonomonas sp. Marseille-P4677 TaxID=2364790 RepID=UPI0019137839|nr:porin [Dysgonomonas sp. Marseille-P4677]MBK5720530.1 hypothetical protein [Dysgonomonas sp. Marseille-P4677]